jgi:Predicted metal-dependent hydrolase with the TIM-barrel fold
MTDAADTVFLDGEVHTLERPDKTREAVAVSGGAIVRVGSTYDVEFLVNTETEVIDLDGRVLLPGFIDAHTHLTTTGRYLVHADLSTADSPERAVELLAARAAETDEEWVLGYGYDESGWDPSRYLTRDDLETVATDRPVAAFREDMHVASVNGEVLDRLRDAMPTGDIKTADARPTGVVVEEAVDPVYRAVKPDRQGTRELVTAALDHANALGVTGVHDMVRQSHAPRVYRDLDAEDELTLRVRLNYWTDHLDSIADAGLRTNHGSEMVQTGAIKSFSDGSLGGRTAKLHEPYDDGEGTGQWVVDPDELREYVRRADELGLQFTTHAIGGVAIDRVLDVFADCESPGDARHRIEHVELATDEAIDRFAELDIVASVQPNFLKWAVDDGLYASRLGDRTPVSNRFDDLLDAGVEVAFGSDGMPLDPLLGIHWTVNAPEPSQRVSVTDALRAYTLGSAYAGFDDQRLGTISVGKRADLVALEQSPWDETESIRSIDVGMTVVDGEVVYEK